MKILVIDYGSGNLKSVANALEFVSGAEIVVSRELKDFEDADKIILPGVGAFGDCVTALEKFGLVDEIKKQVLVNKKPFLGICVGMQLLAQKGFEDGEFKGLGFIDGEVVKIQGDDLKIPQMGWNELEILRDCAILSGIASGEHVYFANSYRFVAQNQENIVAQVDYGVKINAVVVKNNVVGIQFHPEKSGEIGLKILSNFLSWRY